MINTLIKATNKNITAQATLEAEKFEKDHSLFFERREVIKYFADSLRVALHRGGYNTSMNVRFDTSTDAVAYTDGKNVVINYGSEFFDGLNLVDHVLCVLGVATHEQAHVRYTPFKALKEDSDKLLRGVLPCEPNLKGNKTLQKYLREFKAALGSEKKRQILASLFHSIHNIIEDGYIENKFLDEYNGELADALCAVREFQFYKGDTISQVLEKSAGKPQWIVYHNLMLSYAKYGTFLCNKLSELDCPHLKNLQPVFPIIDRYIEMPKGHAAEKTEIIIEVMVNIWPVINEWLLTNEAMQALMEQLREMAQSEGTDGQTTKMPSGLNSNGTSMNDDEDSESSGSGSPSGKGSSARNSAAEKTKKALENAEKASGSASKEDKDSEDEGSSGKGSGEEDAAEAVSDKVDENGEEIPEHVKTQSNNSKQAAMDSESAGHRVLCDVIADEAGRIDNSCEGKVENVGEGKIEEVNINSNGYDGAASDILNLINSQSRDAALTTLEEERISSARSDASNYKLDGLHKNINFRINRIGHVSDELIRKYNEVSPTLLPISRVLQRKLKKELKERSRGMVLTSQMTGTKLQTNAYHRVDGKIWTSKKLPSPTNLSIGILIDESGSMSGYSRATSARAAAIVLEDFCRGLEIPCCIYGHTSGQSNNHSVDLYNYVSFDNIDGKDKYRLMDISARSGNRDGAALKYVGDKLIQRTEENKILIIISDGQPADTGYYGQEAEDDVRNVKKQLNRAGVVVFAAAIGSDKENIHRIYGDGFMDITDLNEMPKILCKLVSRFVK